MDVLRWCSTLLVVALANPGSSSAQERGTVVGTVSDEITGEALEGATVSLPGTDIRVVTDAQGIFELASVLAGDLTARVEQPGYATVVEQIEVLPDEVTLFRFFMSPLEIAIQGLVVRARGDDPQGPAVTEARRSDRSRTALDLLREQMPGVMVRSSLGAETGIRIRGSSSLLYNDPAIYLDGIRMSDGGSVSGVHALEQIPAEWVLRIRILHGPSAAARYGDAASGVILVETR